MKHQLALLCLLACSAAAQAQNTLDITLVGHVDDTVSISWAPLATSYRTGTAADGTPIYSIHYDYNSPVATRYAQESYGGFKAGDAITVQLSVDADQLQVLSGSISQQGLSNTDSAFMLDNVRHVHAYNSVLNVDSLVLAQSYVNGSHNTDFTFDLRTAQNAGWSATSNGQDIWNAVLASGLSSAKGTLGIRDGTCTGSLSMDTLTCGSASIKFDQMTLSLNGMTTTVAAVPEPGTFAMWALGVLGLGIATARHRRA